MQAVVIRQLINERGEMAENSNKKYIYPVDELPDLLGHDSEVLARQWSKQVVQ